MVHVATTIEDEEDEKDEKKGEEEDEEGEEKEEGQILQPRPQPQPTSVLLYLHYYCMCPSSTPSFMPRSLVCFRILIDGLCKIRQGTCM